MGGSEHFLLEFGWLRSRVFFFRIFVCIESCVFFVFPVIFGVELIGLTNHVIFTNMSGLKMSDARKREDKDDQADCGVFRLFVSWKHQHINENQWYKHVILCYHHDLQASKSNLEDYDTDRQTGVSGICCFSSKGFQNFHLNIQMLHVTKGMNSPPETDSNLRKQDDIERG